jgi:PemK-like, MazF-like toxin of type II toxin-antitoxin system
MASAKIAISLRRRCWPRWGRARAGFGLERLVRRALVMRQGEIYWLRFGAAGSELVGRRSAVVVQHDRFNRSRIQTTVVAAVISNLLLAGMPGNVRLRRGRPTFPARAS